MDQDEKHTAMLLALGVPPPLFTVARMEWYYSAYEFLAALDYTTVGARRTQLNAFLTWLQIKERYHESAAIRNGSNEVT